MFRHNDVYYLILNLYNASKYHWDICIKRENSDCNVSLFQMKLAAQLLWDNAVGDDKQYHNQVMKMFKEWPS